MALLPRFRGVPRRLVVPFQGDESLGRDRFPRALPGADESEAVGLWHLGKPQAFIQRWPMLLGRPEHSLDELADALLAELAEEIRRQRSQPDDNCTVILVRRPGCVENPPLEDIP